MKTKFYPLILLFLSIFYINAAQAYYQFPIEINNESSHDIEINKNMFDNEIMTFPEKAILELKEYNSGFYTVLRGKSDIIGEIDMKDAKQQKSEFVVKIPYSIRSSHAQKKVYPYNKKKSFNYSGTFDIRGKMVFNDEASGFSLEIQTISKVLDNRSWMLNHSYELKMPLTCTCENGKIVINAPSSEELRKKKRRT